MKFNKLKSFTTLAVALLLIFVALFTYCYFFLNYSFKLKQQNYLSTVNNLNEYQKKYDQLLNNQNNSSEPEPSLFSDGKTAILSAYENFLKEDNYEAIIYGNIHANAKIVQYNMELSCKIVKTNGAVDSTITLYCKETSSRSSASHTTMNNGIITEQRTKNVSKVNGKIVADFSGCEIITHTDPEKYKNLSGVKPGELYYTINKKTLVSAKNFYAKRNIKGFIESYNTEFTLSQTLAVSNYVKMLSKIIEGSKNYKFNYCTGSAIINNDGKMKSLVTKEQYTFDFNLFGDAYWPVICNSNLNITINY